MNGGGIVVGLLMLILGAKVLFYPETIFDKSDMTTAFEVEVRFVGFVGIVNALWLFGLPLHRFPIVKYLTFGWLYHQLFP